MVGYTLPMTLQKRCSVCHVIKPRTDFPKDANHSGGISSRCRDCLRKYQRERRTKRVALGIQVGLKPRAKARFEEVRRLFPERGRASKCVCRAVISGRLVRGPCNRCGAESTSESPSHGHHEDYSKPLDVEWLCASCHGKENAKRKVTDHRPLQRAPSRNPDDY